MQAVRLCPRARLSTEALAAGVEPDTAFLAGGTELLNWLRLGMATPRRVVDIARIDGLDTSSRCPAADSASAPWRG